MSRRDPRTFDKSRPLVMGRFTQLYEHEMAPGDPLTILKERDPEDEGKTTTKGEITLDVAVRLWVSEHAVYADERTPTPVETPAEYAQRVVDLEDMGDDQFLIRAPWLGEGEVVEGREAAEQRVMEIVDKGDTKGVTMEGGDGGWYSIAAPWLDEPVKVQGKDDALAKEAEIINAGAPVGWRAPTEEEKARAAEQERLLAEAREIADREAAEAAERDRLAAEAAAAAEAEAEAARQHAQDTGPSNQTPPQPVQSQDGTEETVEATDFVVHEVGSNGHYQVTGPGMAEPERIRGKAKAEERAEELRKAYAAEKETDTASD